MLTQRTSEEWGGQSHIQPEFTRLQEADPELARGILTTAAYRPDGAYVQDSTAVMFGIFQTYAKKR